MLGNNNKLSIILVSFPLFITSFQILATPTCISDIETPVCVDEDGFYYFLGNGTWNVSLTEGEELTERESFLSKLQTNQCPVSVGALAPKCDNDCCYCILRLPLPRHVITDRALVPQHITCLERLDDDWKHENWHLTRDSIQQCKTGDPVRLPFVCVVMDNLKELKLMYNNPQVLNQNSYYENVRQKRPAWSWRNTSAIAAKAEAVNQSIWKIAMDEPTDEANENTTIFTEKLNGIEYNWFTTIDQSGQNNDHVIVDDKSINNLTLSFSVRFSSATPSLFMISKPHFLFRDYIEALFERTLEIPIFNTFHFVCKFQSKLEKFGVSQDASLSFIQHHFALLQTFSMDAALR